MGNKNLTIGERLQEKRKSLGLEIKEVADEIQAPKKFIEALELDDYKVFTAKIYALGFLKKYLKFLNLDGEARDLILEEFNQEWEVILLKKNREVTKIPEIKDKVFIVTPKFFSFLLGAIFILFIAVYFYYQFTFLGSPELVVERPAGDSYFESAVIEIYGRGDPSTDLTVNGRPVYINEKGEFNDLLNLASGLNTLEFIAVNKFGKATKVLRHVLVKDFVQKSEPLGE